MKKKSIRKKKNIKCLWFGCEPHPQDPAPPEALYCDRCGDLMSYEDIVGVTRSSEFKKAVKYWFFRRWIPEKCHDCGRRYGDHSGCIPF